MRQPVITTAWLRTLRGASEPPDRPAPRKPPPPLDTGFGPRIPQRKKSHNSHGVIDFKKLASKARQWRRGDVHVAIRTLRHWRAMAHCGRLKEMPTFPPEIMAKSEQLASRVSRRAAVTLLTFWRGEAAAHAAVAALVDLLLPHTQRAAAARALAELSVHAAISNVAAAAARRFAVTRTLVAWRRAQQKEQALELHLEAPQRACALLTRRHTLERAMAGWQRWRIGWCVAMGSFALAEHARDTQRLSRGWARLQASLRGARRPRRWVSQRALAAFVRHLRVAHSHAALLRLRRAAVTGNSLRLAANYRDIGMLRRALHRWSDCVIRSGDGGAAGRLTRVYVRMQQHEAPCEHVCMADVLRSSWLLDVR